MAEVIRRRIVHGTPLVPASAMIGGLGLALWTIGLIVTPEQAMHSYLAAFAYVTSLVLGTLIFLMIGHIMNAAWVVAVRRLQEAVVAALPVLGVLFVPIAVASGHVYPWVEPPADVSEHTMHLLDHKRPYLNVSFFVARAIVYFAVWIVAAELLRRWSLVRDRRVQSGAEIDHEALSTRMRVLSAAMLPLVGLCLTFAAFDWLMSLDPTWFSSMFGVYYFAGGFLGSMALLTVLAYAARRRGLLAEELTGFHFHALGRLLLAFVIFWAYIAFFQAMLIQIANKPEEVTFYLLRLEGSWSVVSYALIIGHFAAPFLVLLPRHVKFRPRLLAGIAIWILFIHYVDIYWLVLPVLHGRGAMPHWLDVVALVGVAGVATAFAAWRQRGLSALPEGDPRLSEALSYRSAL
jgi:hypothetical protein